jgi:hypothetical protein
MGKIEYGTKYIIHYWDQPSEAVYLGKTNRENVQNSHMFMAWHPFMKKGSLPVFIALPKFKINGNEIDAKETRKRFPKINSLEREYLTNLAQKYWG